MDIIDRAVIICEGKRRGENIYKCLICCQEYLQEEVLVCSENHDHVICKG
jgi:hypothetical protein